MRRLLILHLTLIVTASCAPKSVVRLSGARSPLAGAPALWDRALTVCRGVHTVTAELRISGRVGRQKLRGRAIVGAAEPASLRLEGVAPFGPPAFILVARDGRGTLLLPRDRRVLRDAVPEKIVEALTGVSMGPDALRLLLAGCFAPADAVTGGEQYGDRWAVLAFDRPGNAAYLRRDGADWRLVSSTVGAITVEYDQFSGQHPQLVRIRTSGVAATELTLALSQVEMNTTLESDAFELKIGADAEPLTLDELRSAGPLGAQK